MSKERLIKSTSATSDSQGRATFTLGPAELGYVYEGSVQIPGCPAGALFMATVLTTTWGQWAGPTNYGPIQLYGGEYLTVTATGLNPNTTYALTIFGVWGSENDFEPVPPGAPMSVVSVETATLLVNGVTPGGVNHTITNIRPPTLTRRLTIITPTGSGGVATLTGDVTGTVYGSFLTSSHVPHYFAIEPAVDPTYTLAISNASTGPVWVLASFSNPLVETNSAEPLQVVSVFGPFNSSFGDTTLSPNTANQTVIVAQGSATSIILQSIDVSATGMNGPTRFRFHDSSGLMVADIILPSTGSERVVFPGGYEMPANTSLQCDTSLSTSGTLLKVSGTMAIAPTFP